MVVCFPVGVITSDWNLYPFLDKFTNSSLNILIYSICSQDPKYKINCLISIIYGWLKIRLLPTRIISSSELEIKSFVISKHFWSNFEFGIFCDISWEPKLLKKSLYCSLLNNILCELCSTYLSIFLLCPSKLVIKYCCCSKLFLLNNSWLFSTLYWDNIGCRELFRLFQRQINNIF